MVSRRFALIAVVFTIFSFADLELRVYSQDAALDDRQQKIATLKSRLSDLGLQIQERERMLESTQAKLAASKSRLDDVQNKRSELIQRQDLLGVSGASFDEILRLLQTQRVQLTIDLAGLEARRATLLDQRNQDQKDSAEASVKIRNALTELVEFQRNRLAQFEALVQKGAVSPSEIMDAKQQLLEAEIRLAEANHANDNGDQKMIDSQLLTVSLGRAESAARLAKVEQLLGEYVRARATLESANRVQMENNSLETAVNGLSERVENLENDLARARLQEAQLREQLKDLSTPLNGDDR